MARWTAEAPETVSGYALSLIAKAYGAKVAEVATIDKGWYVVSAMRANAMTTERIVREYAQTLVDQHDHNSKGADILKALEIALKEAEDGG